MRVSKGDILKIEGKSYTVLKVMREIDRYDAKSRKMIGQHMQIELSDNDKEVPTHIIKIYSEDRVILMEASPQKGIIFNYTKGKSIPISSIISQ